MAKTKEAMKAAEPLTEDTPGGRPKKIRKRKSGFKAVLLTILVFVLIVAIAFCYFYIKLHGWKSVPFINTLRFLPFIGD